MRCVKPQWYASVSLTRWHQCNVKMWLDAESMGYSAYSLTCYCRQRLPTAEVSDTFLDAFGDVELGKQALNDPLVLFEPPTLRFFDELLSSTEHIQTSLQQIKVPLLVRDP